MEREGLDGRHDGKSPGRPRLLNPDQEKAIEGDLDGPPSDSGFMRGSWNAGMIAGRTGDGFGVIPCSRRTILRIAGRLGFSTCEPWSVPYNGATPEGPAAFIEEPRGITTGWNGVGRTLPAVDAAALRDSPASGRGLRRRGGKEHRPHQPLQKVQPPDRGSGGRHAGAAIPRQPGADDHAALVENMPAGATSRSASCGRQRQRPRRQDHPRVHCRHGRDHQDGAHSAPHPADIWGVHGRDGHHIVTEKRLAQR